MPGAELPLVTALPFVVLLLAIALTPLAAPEWWHVNRNKGLVAGLISAPILVYLGLKAPHLLTEKALEYFDFIVVIGTLFVITGGIHIQGSPAGTPLGNTGMLGLGAVLANLVGTTGASALLIRPLLRANKGRKRVAHVVVFFIFIVANCGGLLTPIGDPPLLLGYLKGVPFDWTLRLWPQYVGVNGILLVVFYLWDRRLFEPPPPGEPSSEPLRITGAVEILVLLGVIVSIALSAPSLVIGGLGVVGYFAGSQDRRAKNDFTLGPLIEVAVLFAGIFLTMAPALELLNTWAGSPNFALTKPAHFFWASGALSSVLDNAPTYLAFAAGAAGLHGVAPHGQYIGTLAHDPSAAKILAAISTGAVYMGANTYIGNAPNFMVRAIAEENGVRMPSFFGYMAYSAGILLPLFVVISLVFFKN
jgi:Na+/H+ antiporter NhaD/arsenite permease-like protein